MTNEERITKQIYQEDGMWIGEISGRILFKDKDKTVVEEKLLDFIRNMDLSLFKVQPMPIYPDRNK